MDQLFYSTQIFDDIIILPEDEAFHVIKVFRKKIGDQIKVVDGYGNLYHATIDSEKFFVYLCLPIKQLISLLILLILDKIFSLVFLTKKQQPFYPLSV